MSEAFKLLLMIAICINFATCLKLTADHLSSDEYAPHVCAGELE